MVARMSGADFLDDVPPVVRLPDSVDVSELPDGRTILGTRYLYNGAGMMTPVLVIAVEGGVGDWAAYIAGFAAWDAPTMVYWDRLAAHGAKLPEDVARAWFPELELKAYRE